ncbi:MAG TPA: hypothetical protein VHN20_14605 [Beijerinckiaceae bacterium]|nr:hypothetical protein [Beijerinckiaceae bacterium]
MLERTQRIVESHREPRVCPAEVEPLMQTLLSTLADIDFEYEYERRKLNCSAADRALKTMMRQRLEQRHNERRRPYVEELTRLHARLRTARDLERP